MKIQNTSLFLLFLIFTISCEQLGDSLRLPGEDPKEIIYYELNNDYLAPESREFIEQNFPSQSVNTSYILIGKNTYGFEADLTNDKSLSFDEDGAYKFDRDHPFIKDIYEKGKFGRGKGEGKGDKEDREGGEKDDEDKEKGEGTDKGRGDERCFEFVMPYTVMMPDSSFITLTDGASDGGEGIAEDMTDREGNTEVVSNSYKGKLVINVGGKNYYSENSREYSSSRMTTQLLNIIKQRYNTNNIGFFLIPNKSRKHLHWAIEDYDSNGKYVGYDLDRVMKNLTKDNVHLTSKTGYDKYFITVGNTRVESADLSSLDSDAKTSDIKRFFKNSMKGRLKSRVLLNNFIEEVA